ncbi:MAG: ABC transporter substrate-binding protein [Pseudomonadota bacterium]
MTRLLSAVAACIVFCAQAFAGTFQQSPILDVAVDAGTLAPVDIRLPQDPLVVDLAAKGREPGTYGGTLRTMVTRSKDVRQMVVYGYARLVGYDENYEIKPDILRDLTVEENRIFTLHIRDGHKWSDGSPFTSADFQYWWDSIANHTDLAPAGPPDIMRAEGHLPIVSFPDALTVRFEWPVAHPSFLPALAAARPPFIYRPSAFLKQFHGDFADPDDLKALTRKHRVRSWAALHNKSDNMYKNDNPDLPTLQPWVNATRERKAVRYHFERNPYFHRVDSAGNQLPYIDKVEMTIVGGGLVVAKANAGEVDLQARAIDFRDVSILKKGEVDGADYTTRLWANGAASQIAIYPNLNFNDPVWRAVIRDVRFRRALSMGIDRRMINRALYFGMAAPGGMTVLRQSALFEPEFRSMWANYDPAAANAMLDEMGLTERDNRNIRLLPDGRPMEFVIETAGERQEVENALAIITDTWREIGVKLVMRPLDRDILRNRVFAGVSMASTWFGWNNGVPSADTPPDYIAPMQQEFLSWPKWGQYYQTGGMAGEAPDMGPSTDLMDLLEAWYKTDSTEKRTQIWKDMLAIHAENQFAIGLLSEAPQPVVVSNQLRNVPKDGTWAWDPGAHFGIHRVDEFWFVDPSDSNS